jgi:hypothetical protein
VWLLLEIARNSGSSGCSSDGGGGGGGGGSGGREQAVAEFENSEQVRR